MPFYRIRQHVVHSIMVRADNEDDAMKFEQELADDGFTDVDWGDTTIDEVPERLVTFISAIDDIRKEKDHG